MTNKYFRILGLALALCLFGNADAQRAGLEGFLYGSEATPMGKEWENPEMLSLNKEQPHAWFFSFDNKEEARRVLPYGSRLWKSLNGVWKFHWAPDPSERPGKECLDAPRQDWDDIEVPGCWNVQGIQKDGSLKYGVPIYCNQPVIFQHKVEVDDWRGGVMREPAKDWVTYKHRNEVGTYVRNFTVPAAWNGKEVYIDFDGVNSFFYLWINGKYVGFSKNSRNTASFNITKYLKRGADNTVAVEVYRNSDGSFLEAQDMWRLPGIYRSVSLRAKSATQVNDIIVRTTDEKAGKVKVETTVSNLLSKAQKDLSLVYSIYSCKLWEDANTPVEGLQGISLAVDNISAQGEKTVTTEMTIPDCKLWSSEEPYRYIIVAELKDKKGKTLETVSAYFGVRKVEIRETPAQEDEFGLAGRYYYINGKPVKLKGVNRQEINLATGNTITHKQIIDEIMLMRRGNINHVRTSHYSNDPFWYYACDKYGIYLEDEANIESHQYYYGKASLSHVPEFLNAHVARVMEAAHAHVNAPSVVIWSLGNEAGPGDNFKVAYEKLHEFDSSRPVQYERNNNIVDMGSNQYPSIGWTREAVKGEMADLKYPFHISEYAHSMGNAGGNLKDYWDAIESTNFFCGGAIWDWVDQALWNYTEDGTRYMAYGGDFGDKPNSGMFCMNGILFPDHTPKPEFDEVKKVYQYLGVRMCDAEKGIIELFNKNYFTALPLSEIEVSLWKDGKKTADLTLPVANGKETLAPRTGKQFRIAYDHASLDAGADYYLRVQQVLGSDKPWANKGYVQAEEELAIKEAIAGNYADAMLYGGKLLCSADDKTVSIKGEDFAVDFDNLTGTIRSLTYDGKAYFADGSGPRFDAYRAPVDNDNWGGARSSWATDGLQAMECKTIGEPTVKKNGDGSVTVEYDVRYQSPYSYQFAGNFGHWRFDKKAEMTEEDFTVYAKQWWRVYPDGSVELQSGVYSNNPAHSLARMGYAMTLDKSLNEYTYYGRGPRNNYNDRCSGYFHGVYHSTVKDQFEPFPKPQDMGNREGVRWCALTDSRGVGLQFIFGADGKGCASALPYSDLEMTLAAHPYELPESNGTHLHLDAMMTGLGGNSCGQGGPLVQDRVKAHARNMAFMIRPVRATDDDASLTARSKVKFLGEVPEVQDPVIERVPLKVVYASSQEPDDGEATNLVDGNAETSWITAYSVTVAQFPHWVDFDAGEMKTIKGFSYLPIAEGDYANVKHYRIFVSQDGKDWGEAIMEGEFPQNTYSNQKVLFPTPVKARYIRFYCLDSQNGRDYAGGAEFGIIIE